jgi:hypothetical protein
LLTPDPVMRARIIAAKTLTPDLATQVSHSPLAALRRLRQRGRTSAKPAALGASRSILYDARAHLGDLNQAAAWTPVTPFRTNFSSTSGSLTFSDAFRSLFVSFPPNLNQSHNASVSDLQLRAILPDGVTFGFGPTVTPLPSALTLFLTGVGALGYAAHRRRRPKASAASRR